MHKQAKHILEQIELFTVERALLAQHMSYKSFVIDIQRGQVVLTIIRSVWNGGCYCFHNGDHSQIGDEDSDDFALLHDLLNI